jgi:ubiquinone/menaquinone biosynthesis C-methylase UbiE
MSREQQPAGPWEAMDPAEAERFGEVILDRAEQERWSRAIFLGGLPYMWRRSTVPRGLALDRLELEPGATVLVLGEAIAPSRIDVELAERVGPAGEVVAIDFLEEARAKYAEGVVGSGGQRATWRYDYADDLEADRFDAVLVFQGVQHAEDWSETGRSLRRVMKPGARVVLAEIAFGPPFIRRVETDVHIEYLMEKLFSRMGLGTMEEFPYHGPTELLAALDGIFEDLEPFSWRGIELLWGRKP